MISVKYSDARICIYSDYGCRDASCPLNKFHERKETHFGITNIPHWCLKTIDVISDESVNSVFRDLIKTTAMQGKIDFVPQEIRDIVDRKKPKILTPLERWVRGENVTVGKGVMIPNNRKKPCLKNLIGHVWENQFGSFYVIHVLLITKNKRRAVARPLD
jgi:hypothetical protein